MTDTPVLKAVESESEALSDIPDSSSAVFESPDTLKTATSSSHHDSEYDTASDTPSSDLEDEDDFEDDDVEDNGEEGSVVLDLQRADGEEDGEKKKVDDDEDRSNPQYIPKRGIFYEHDDRTAEEPEAERKVDEEGKEEKSDSPTPTAVKKPVKKSAAAADRWSHDRYNENEQAPKSRAELVNSYGYDIRNEDGPPRARRRRRYTRGPNKYTRNWEDEKAYAKLSSQQEKQQRNTQEEFPELGSRENRKAKPSLREEKENKNDENRRSNKSPNQRSQQQTHQDGHRSQGDRYDSNRTFNDIFDGNRQQLDGPHNYEMNRSHDGNRSQNYEGGRSQNDRFDGNRTKFFDNVRQNDRYEGNRQQNDHYDGSRSNNRYEGNNRYSNDQKERNQNDRYDNKYDNKRSSDKFDGNRLQNDRYDQRMERGGDKERNWDRRGGKMNDNRSGGFRNTIEFKNQNRNKPFDNVNNSSQIQSGSKGFASSGFNQRQTQSTEYESDMPVESLSFTNSKLAAAPQSMSERYPSLEYSQIDSSRHRSVSEIDRPERPITGRQLGSSSSRSSNQMQQSPLPIVNPIHNQQPSMNIQQQISSQPIQQQPQLLPQQQQNTNLMTTESRSAKRYSTLRQRTSEAVQTLSIPQHSLHDLHEQQMLLQDAALMLQIQQSQEQIQLQPNLAHQQPPSTNYATQPIPMQLQNEYATLGPKSQASGSAQPNQQPLIQTPVNQNQASSQSAQYPSAYFASPSEFSAQSTTAIQPTAQPSQLMNSQQYPAQYPQPPAAPYVQPPPQTSYIQPAVNQQQQLLNYVPTIPPTQQQFSAVQSFSTYPTVPNYNAVPSGITQSGITYYPPQTQPRPILSQRRPTNAIPILAPSERFAGKARNRQNQFDEDDKTTLIPPIGSPENIDHILDNMFTQRPPFQPPTRKSNSPSPESNVKASDSQNDSAQSSVTGTSSTFDGGNKQMEFVDAGIGKMSLDEISQMDNAIAVLNQHEAVTDSAAS